MTELLKVRAQTTGGTCRGLCGGKIHKGEEIVRVSLGRFVHIECLEDRHV